MFTMHKQRKKNLIFSEYFFFFCIYGAYLQYNMMMGRRIRKFILEGFDFIPFFSEQNRIKAVYNNGRECNDNYCSNCKSNKSFRSNRISGVTGFQE